MLIVPQQTVILILKPICSLYIPRMTQFFVHDSIESSCLICIQYCFDAFIVEVWVLLQVKHKYCRFSKASSELLSKGSNNPQFWLHLQINCRLVGTTFSIPLKYNRFYTKCPSSKKKLFYILTNKNCRTRCFFLSESCHVHEWKPQPVTWAGIMYILHAIDQCIQYVSQHLLSRP